MTYSLNKKGLSVFELLASTVLISLVMLLLGSVTYFVFNSYQKISKSSKANITSVIITQSVLYKLNSYAPSGLISNDDVLVPNGSKEADWKRVLAKDFDPNNKTCLIFQRFKINSVVYDEGTGSNVLVEQFCDGTKSTCSSILKVEMYTDTNGKVELSISEIYSLQNIVDYYNNQSYLNLDKFLYDPINSTTQKVDLNGVNLTRDTSIFSYVIDDKKTYFSVNMSFGISDPNLVVPFSILIDNKNQVVGG